MKSSKADQYPGYVPARGRAVGLIFAASFPVLVACLFLFAPVVMFAVAFVNGIGEAFSSIGILAGIIGVILKLAELLWLLQIGEYGQFAMKILEALSSPTPR